MSPNELKTVLLRVLCGVEGLRPAAPVPAATASRLPWDLDQLAVDVSETVIEIYLVATRLPLPALLDSAGATLRKATVGTPWENTTLRLVVTDIDAAAFRATTRSGEREPRHTIRS